MNGGGQTQKVEIGLNPEPRGSIGVQGVVHVGGAYGQALPPKRPIFAQTVQQGFGDPTSSIPFSSLDRNHRSDQGGYQMESRDQGEDDGQGGEAEPQQGAYGPQPGGRDQEWDQGDRRDGVESNYQEVTAGVQREMDISDASQSEGSEEEEDDEEDDGDVMVENDDSSGGGEEKRGMDGVGEQVGSVGGNGGLPVSHSQIGGMDPSQVRQEVVRVDGGFQRSALDRERAALKAIGNPGLTNSPFGIFHSPSSTLPFLNSFSSPSNSNPQLGGNHPDTTPAQNGGGMGGVGVGVGIGVVAGSGPAYSLARDGGLSREVSREGFRENAVVASLQEQPRITPGPSHEHMQSSTDADNYYTTLLNTQIPSNNGLKVAESGTDSVGRRRLGDPQSTAEPSLRRILSDPLTGTLMEDAMIINCGHSVGSAGLRQVMETCVCIICGATIRTENMVPNYALRLVVQAYKREEEMNGNTGIKSVKRRRDPAQESIGPTEQAATDAARAKGVQFPFVVSDRVMIKGNKRTPERFVGREAVITTQCLNGWYLVRTLDSGESVRLQYRSLQKVGGSWPGNEPSMAEFAGVNCAQFVQ